MIKTIEKLNNSLAANEKHFDLFIEEAKEKGIRTEFSVGQFSVDTHGMSRKQKATMATMLWQRFHACKELGDQELADETAKDWNDFKDSLAYIEKREHILDLIKKDNDYLIEAKSLLTKEDKIELFKKKLDSRTIEERM